MAFPTIPTVAAGRVLSALATNPQGTHTSPDLSSLTKSNGDLLIAIVIFYAGNSTNAEFSAWGGGFTEFGDFASSAGATMAIGCAYKWSDGTETGTFTVTSVAVGSNDSAFFLLAIPGAHGTTPPEAGSFTTNAAAAADPASFDPSGWGTEDTLWIAVAGSGETATGGTYTGIASAPTNYTDYADSGISADAVGGVEGAVAFRQLNAASVDVGTFSVDTSNARNAALVIAVRPTSVTTTTSYAQAQTDIKAVVPMYAQAQADIKNTATNYTNPYGQAQADIKQTYQVFSQAQTDIKQKYFGLAQAQADIKAAGYGEAQAQADIKATVSMFAQAQADIKATSYGFAQAQAKLPVPATITYGHAQAYAVIDTGISTFVDTFTRTETDAWGTSDSGLTWEPVDGIDTWLSVDGSVGVWLPDGLGSIGQLILPDFYFGRTQELYFEINLDTEVPLQFGVQIPLPVNYPDSVSWVTGPEIDIMDDGHVEIWNIDYLDPTIPDITIVADTWYSIRMLFEPISTTDSIASVKIWEKNTTEPDYQSVVHIGDIDIAQLVPGPFILQVVAQYAVSPLPFYFDNFNIEPFVPAVSNYGHAQAQADIKQVYSVFAQSQADIKATYWGLAQSQADIKATGRGYAQAQADIKATSNAFAQAQAWIKIADIEGFAQAQARIKNTYFGFGQAQGDIKAASRGFAQSQADVKAVSRGFAQAQALIKTTYVGLAQAQGYIKATVFGFAQAQAKLLAALFITTYAHAQAKALIRHFRTDQIYLTMADRNAARLTLTDVMSLTLSMADHNAVELEPSDTTGIIIIIQDSRKPLG